jgi:hypothetical protein
MAARIAANQDVSVTSGGALQLVFNCASDPGGYRAVVLAGSPPDFLQQFGRKPDGDRGSESSGASAWWALRLLILRLGVEVVLLAGVMALSVIGPSGIGQRGPERPRRTRLVGTASRTVACRCERNDQHPTSHLGAHRPMRRWLRRVEERVAGPDVDVAQSEVVGGDV